MILRFDRLRARTTASCVRHRRWVVGSVAALFALSTETVAQNPTGADSLSLTGALALARLSGPELREVDAQRTIATGRAREAAQWTNPTLEWRRENLGSVLEPDIFATLYLPVDVSGRRRAFGAAAGAAAQRANAAAARDRVAYEMRVVYAWIQVASLQQQIRVLAQQALQLAEVERIESSRVRAGSSAETALWRIEVENGRAELALIQLQAELERARAALSSALGVRVPVVVTSLDHAVAIPVPPTLPAMLVTNDLRPDVVEAEQALRESEARARGESRGAFGNDWQLQGGTKQTSGFLTGQLGVAVPLPLFHRNDAARDRAQAEVRMARAVLDARRLHASAEAQAALASYRMLRDSVTRAPTLPERGTAIAASMQVAWQEGAATLAELLDALRSSADARITHTQWLADLVAARFELERAAGVRISPDSPLSLPMFDQIRSAR